MSTQAALEVDQVFVANLVRALAALWVGEHASPPSAISVLCYRETVGGDGTRLKTNQLYPIDSRFSTGW